MSCMKNIQIQIFVTCIVTLEIISYVKNKKLKIIEYFLSPGRTVETTAATETPSAGGPGWYCYRNSTEDDSCNNTIDNQYNPSYQCVTGCTITGKD